MDSSKLLISYEGSSYQKYNHLMAKALRINCAIHHVQEVKDLLQNAGILYIFLPPYSPDFNPAEELFSYIKYYLKDHDIVLQSMDSLV